MRGYRLLTVPSFNEFTNLSTSDYKAPDNNSLEPYYNLSHLSDDCLEFTVLAIRDMRPKQPSG